MKSSNYKTENYGTAGAQYSNTSIFTTSTPQIMQPRLYFEIHAAIQANFGVHPCTNPAVNDKRQQLEASFKKDVILR